MPEPQETRIGQKQERIEKPQVSSSKPRKVYVLGVAFVAVLLLGTSFGIMISATTPSIPTVIEPGSMVGSADYIVFKDGVDYYAKNGTTGQITHSGTNATTLLAEVMDNIPNGGTIFIQTGNYTLTGGLVIDHRGIIFVGTSGTIPLLTHVQPYGTILYGDVTIQAQSVSLSNLEIIGDLNLTSTTTYTGVAQFCNIDNVYLAGSMKIFGKTGANAAQVPFSISISNSLIWPRITAPSFNITSATAGIEHILVTNTQIWQTYPDSVVHLQGYTNSITFLNTLFIGNTVNTVVNLTGTGDCNDLRFIACVFEFEGPAESSVLVAIPIERNTDAAEMVFTDCAVRSASHPTGVFGYVVKSETGVHLDWHYVFFDRLRWFSGTTLRFMGGNAYTGMQTTFIKFTDCWFPEGTIVSQTYNSYIGEFHNCYGLNPVGKITNPFSGVNDNWRVISLASSNTPTSSVVASVNYTVHDVPMLINSTGGTGVSITIYDPSGNVVASGATVLNGEYLPLGYKINFGAFSGAPTVTVFGL